VSSKNFCLRPSLLPPPPSSLPYIHPSLLLLPCRTDRRERAGRADRPCLPVLILLLHPSFPPYSFGDSVRGAGRQVGEGWRDGNPLRTLRPSTHRPHPCLRPYGGPKGGSGVLLATLLLPLRSSKKYGGGVREGSG
jgi:hypothetical protein